MALPWGDLWVINFTVGWNGLLFLFLFLHNTRLGNLLDTFCSLNANRNAQSAGNSSLSLLAISSAKEVELVYSLPSEDKSINEGKRGSSETIRENTYDLFKNSFAEFFKVKFNQDSDWLSWFIGFSEGDGAILEHKGRLSFVLTQKDDTVLHQICETLKIGKVKQFYDNKGNRKYSRFIVSEYKGIFLLYLLFNGNIVLGARVNQLRKWNIGLNNASRFNYSLFYISELPKLIENTKEPKLNDAWLSGFTDAEGCFSVKIGNEKKAFYVQLLFILDQKKEEVALNKIALLFSKTHKAVIRTPNKSAIITPSDAAIKTSNLKAPLITSNVKLNPYSIKAALKKTANMYRLTFSCNDKKNFISYKLINYFNRYKLKTSKKESFLIWTEILNIVVNKQPLSSEDLNNLRKLRHNMNYFTLENKTLGYANKS